MVDMSDVDYRAVDTDGVKPEEMDWRQRRSALLEHIEAAGSPRLLNYAELGRFYGVSREQIRSDVERLGEYVDEATDEDAATLEGEAFLWRCARELLRGGEYRKAAQTYLDLEEWRRQDDLSELMKRIEEIEGRAEHSGENPFRVK